MSGFLSGQELFRYGTEFTAGATTLEAIPLIRLPEIAFVGRSNVGKSSLLGSLAKRNNLTRVSKTPGCTQQLNFYNVSEKLMLVDMPGYGYAKASKKEVEGWNRLIFDYLRGRPNLRQVCLLVDARHGIKPNDEETMAVLDEHAVSYRVVFTKCDKVGRDEIILLKDSISAIGKKYPALHPESIATSSSSGEGLEELRNQLARFVN